MSRADYRLNNLLGRVVSAFDLLDFPQIPPTATYKEEMLTEFVETLGAVPRTATLARLNRARWLRRGFLAILIAFIVAALFNLLGIRTAEKTATAQGYELTVTYGKVTRLGLATQWTAEISKPGGFTGPITVATTGSYFEIFDENGMDPAPVSTVTEGDFIVWEFDPPEGDTLTIDFDARIEPVFKGGRTASTTVRENGADVVGVTYRTTVLP